MTEEYAYLPNFRFMLRVNGIDVPLKSVAAFQRENEYDYIQEGGMNDYVYLRRKPISKPFTLRVERYIPTDFDDPLSNGTELLLPLLLFVGRNSGGKMGFGRYYVFTGAVVMSKEYGGLDSERAGLLTETITIGYNQMFCITNSDDEEEDKEPWQFAEEDGDDIAVNVARKYSKTPKEPLQNKMNIRAFKAGAHKWEFDGLKKGGKGDVSHTLLNEDGEMDKADMIDKRRHFSFASEFNQLESAEMTSTRSAVNSSEEGYGITELSKDEMIEKAKKFEITPDGSVGGNGVIFAPKNIENNKANESDFTKKAKKWGFDKDKTKDGNGVHSTQNSLVTDHKENPDGSSTGLGRPELSVDEMAKNARKFELTLDKNIMGNGTVSARRDVKQNETHKDQFEAGAQKWEFDQKNKAGTGESSRDTSRVKEDTKDTHISKAKKFELTDKNTVGGNGVLLSPHDIDKNKANKDDFKGKRKRWNFDGTKKSGKGDNNTQNQHAVLNEDTITSIGVNEKSKDKLEKLSHRWEFSESTKAGKGTSSSQNNNAVLRPDTVTSIGKKEESKDAVRAKAKKWAFNDTTKAGNGVSSSQNNKAKLNEDTVANIGPKEVSRKTMEAQAKKWQFDNDTKAGNGVSSSQNSKAKLNDGTTANIGPKEDSRETLEGKAKKWQLSGTTKAGTGDKSSQNNHAVLNEDTNAAIGAKELPKETLANKATCWKFEGTSKAGGGEASRNTGTIKELSKEEMAKKAQRGMTTNKAIADFLMK